MATDRSCQVRIGISSNMFTESSHSTLTLKVYSRISSYRYLGALVLTEIGMHHIRSLVCWNDLIHPRVAPVLRPSSLIPQARLTTPPYILALKHRRPWRRIRRLPTIKIIQNALIRRAIRPGQAHRRRRLTRTPTRHIDLRTLHVKLRTLGYLRAVQRDQLPAQQVLARCYAGGDRDCLDAG